MKLIRKLTSIFLAVVMIMSVICVPVHAATINSIEIYSPYKIALSKNSFEKLMSDSEFVNSYLKSISAIATYSDGTIENLVIDTNNFNIVESKDNTNYESKHQGDYASGTGMYDTFMVAEISYTYKGITSNSLETILCLENVTCAAAYSIFEYKAPIKNWHVVSIDGVDIKDSSSYSYFYDEDNINDFYTQHNVKIEYTTFSIAEISPQYKNTLKSLNAPYRNWGKTYQATIIYDKSNKKLYCKRDDGYIEDTVLFSGYLNAFGNVFDNTFLNYTNNELTIGGSFGVRGMYTYIDNHNINLIPKSASSLEIVTPPNKVNYVAGETFDPTGMEVNINFNDGTCEKYEYSSNEYQHYGYTFSSDPLLLGQTEIIISNLHKNSGNDNNCKYNYQIYTKLPITVASKEVASISVKNKPTKTEYIEGETFNPSGLVLKVTYNDGTTEDVSDGYIFETNPLSIDKSNVSISYGGKTTTVPVKVVAKTVDSIKVTKSQSKVKYFVGDNFNPSGMEVTAFYNDGTSAVINNYSYDTDPLTTDDTSVTISYNGKTATTAVVVDTVKLNSVELVSQPTRTEYSSGETFDPTGMIIKGNYSDGTSNVITDYNYDSLILAGQKKVYITVYDEFFVEVPITTHSVVGIKVTTPPNRTTYLVGQKFNPSGMIVEYVYSDGSMEEMADDDYSYPTTPLVSGQQEVYITHGSFYATTPVSVTTKDVSKIEVVTPPEKTTYIEGEIFNPDGMEVKVTYTDGSSEVINSGFSCTGNLTVSDPNVTISFGDKTVDYSVTVVAKTVREIRVIKSPTKIEYSVGESFDPAGMMVAAFYNDDSYAIINNYSYYEDDLTASDTSVTISYSGKTTTTPVIVSDRKLTGITVTKAPNKTSYYTGQYFDPSGMEVTAKYSNGTTSVITDYSYQAQVYANQSNVYITYGNFYATTPISVTGASSVYVVGLESSDSPNKTEYIEGQVFDPTGMTVYLVYSDGTREPVSKYFYDTTPLSAGQNSAYIFYGDYYLAEPITVTAKLLDSISIFSQPNKTEYLEGDVFDPTGMVVMLNYNDGTSEEAKGYKYSVNSLTPSQDEMIIFYGTKTAAVSITVAPRTLEKIKITKAPNKIKYYANETFDPTGMEVTAFYDNGDIVGISGYTYPTTPLTSDSTKAVISFNGKTAETPITVSNLYVTKIDVTRSPNKVTYKAGETFDPTGMVVKATFDDGSSKEINDYAFSSLINIGQSEVYITYGNLYTTVDISTQSVVGIKVTTPPTKTDYLEGEKFDPTGMVVEIVYDDGTTSAINGYIYPTSKLTAGQNEVYITMGDYYAIVPISVAGKVIDHIEITTPPDKVDYIEGEAFDVRGMVVTAFYNDGTSAELAGYTYPKGALTTNDTSLTVSYGGKTASLPINVITKTITELVITKAPDKIKYYTNELFNPEGMVVEAKYNDGTSAIITGYTYPTVALTSSDENVTISFNGKTATTPIVVSDKAIKSIEIITPPDKTTYKAGEEFDPDGMEVNAIYEDGTTSTLKNYSFIPTINKGQTDVYITYGSLYAKQSINVQSIVGIKVTSNPDKTDYLEGDVFDPGGLKVGLVYDDGSIDAITDFSYSTEKLSAGQTIVYITKDGYYTTVDVTVSEKELDHIEITTPPDKVEYVEGEAFDVRGMVVTAFYNDGTSAELAGYTYPKEALTTKDDAIVVSFGGEETKTPITVIEKEVIGISIVQSPDKVKYFSNETFDPTGMVVEAYYNDNTAAIITGYEYPTDILTADMTEITVNYNGKSATTSIYVSDKIITGIYVETQPSKTTYLEGQTFDPTGMVVKATFDDGSEEVITNYSYNNDVIYKNQAKVYVTYNNFYTTVDITALEKEVVSIAILEPPVKVEYVEGQTFDRRGMIVEAEYSDGTKAIITDYTYSDEALNLDDTDVTISYAGKTASTPIKVINKVMTGIHILVPPDKVNYVEGETFDPTGMVVEATYNDGTKEVITDYTYSDKPFEAGDNNVTVEKDGFTDDIEIKLSMSNLSDYLQGKRGDVNRDGSVTNEDAEIIKKYLAGVVTLDNKYAVHTGDVDGDGTITSDDTTLVNNYINNVIDITGKNLVNADINGDGVVSFYDALLIKNHTLNMWSLNDVYSYNADANADGNIDMLDVIWILDTYYRHTTIDHIEITTPPDKVEYVEGQIFDPTGMVVEAIYLDGTKEVITDYTYPVKPLEVEEDKVVINYEGFEAEQSIKVYKNMIVQSTEATTETSTEFTTSNVEDSTEATTNDTEESTEATTEDCNSNTGNADGIKIIRLPYKTEYVEGQVFDPTGILIELFWTNGSITYITEKDVTINDTPLKVNDKFGTIYYEYKWDSEKINVPITVVARKPVSVEIITPPDKVDYTEGEEFDPTGTEAEITYNDGTKEVVSGDDITVVDKDPLTKDDTSVTVEVGGIQAEISVTVVEKPTEATTEVTTESTSESTTESTTENTTTAPGKPNSSGGGNGGGHRITTTESTTEVVTQAVEEETEVTTDNRFKDVIGHWGEEFIEYLHNLGIVNGITDELYYPDNSTKRGDFALVLSRMLELEGTDSNISFTDVPDDSYYAEAIKACAENDIYIGYGNGTFKPEKTITREEMMVIIAKLMKVDLATDYSALDNFKDGTSVSWWSKPYVVPLLDEYVVVGDNGNIKPQADITRAEMATVIYKYLTK